MLSIEYVIAQGRKKPLVVYRIETRARALDVAEQVAQGTLDVVCRMYPTTPPDGFQIFDTNDDLMFRSWERVPLHFGILAKRLLTGAPKKLGWQCTSQR
jgi:hypothetical protein